MDFVLKSTEHVMCTGERNRHGAKIPQESLPLFHADRLLSLGDAVEDFPDPGDTMRQQVDSVVGHVQNPAKNKLDCVPNTVPFAQIVERHRLTEEWGITVTEWTEEMINSVEKGLADTPKMWVLCQRDKFIKENVDILQGVSGCGEGRVPKGRNGNGNVRWRGKGAHCRGG